LGKGEAETIALSIETGADLVILDDHAARAEAIRLSQLFDFSLYDMVLLSASVNIYSLVYLLIALHTVTF
jgi:hypothetical protein